LSSEKYQKINIAGSNDIIKAFANFLLERSTGGLVIDDGTQNGQTALTTYLQPQKDKPFTPEEIDNFFNGNRSYFPHAYYWLLTIEHIQIEDWLAGWKKRSPQYMLPTGS
jgi:hypothetical protein